PSQRRIDQGQRSQRPGHPEPLAAGAEVEPDPPAQPLCGAERALTEPSLRLIEPPQVGEEPVQTGIDHHRRLAEPFPQPIHPSPQRIAPLARAPILQSALPIVLQRLTRDRISSMHAPFYNPRLSTLQASPGAPPMQLSSFRAIPSRNARPRAARCVRQPVSAP